MGVGVRPGGPDIAYIRDGVEADPVIDNGNLHEPAVGRDDLYDEPSLSVFWLQAVYDRIFHQRLDAERGNHTVHQHVRNLEYAGNLVLKTHLLQVDVKLHILDLLGKAHIVRFFGQRIFLEKLPQGNDHLIDFLLIADLCFPCDGVEHVK